MTNITTENVGKHGTITKDEIKLPGKLTDIFRGTFSFSIDGTEMDNAFLLSNGWVFEPDPEPILTPGDVFEFNDIPNTFYVVQADESFRFVSTSPSMRSGHPVLTKSEVLHDIKKGRIHLIHHQQKG